MKNIFSSKREYSVLEIGNIVGAKNNWKSPQRGRIYSPYGIAPSCNCCGGGGLETKIFVEL